MRPITLSGMLYFFILSWDEIVMAMMWNLSPAEARTSASIHDATPPRIYG